MKAKVIEGKTYYNPFIKKEFTVNRISGSDCFIRYEDGIEKIWNKDELRIFIQKSIDRKLDKWEMNL